MLQPCAGIPKTVGSWLLQRKSVQPDQPAYQVGNTELSLGLWTLYIQFSILILEEKREGVFQKIVTVSEVIAVR